MFFVIERGCRVNADVVMLIDTLTFLNPQPSTRWRIKRRRVDVQHDEQLLRIRHLIVKMLYEARRQ